MDSYVVIQIVIIVILLLLSAFFSSAETALTTVNKIRIRSMIDSGYKRADTVLKVTEDSGKMLSAILIGNNIVNLSAASLTTSLTYQLGGDMVALSSGILTVAILLFGEITPKTVATIHAEKLALIYAPIIYVYMKIMTPVIYVINGLSLIILFVFRINPEDKNASITEKELRTIVDVSHEDGILETEEKEMIYNVFDLGDAKAKDIMVPRIHMTFADVNNSFKELLDIFKEDKYTRLPVFEGSIDNVIGTINMKDLLLASDPSNFSIRNIMREAYFTYEYKNMSELLVEMRQASFNIAIVLDEYGATAGLITLEDILEEIVGEIHDEYDDEEEDAITQISENEYRIEASINLNDLNDRIPVNLSSEEYDTLGGFIIEHLDRFPEVGDEITTEDHLKIVVESLDKNRVEHVRLSFPESSDE